MIEMAGTVQSGSKYSLAPSNVGELLLANEKFAQDAAGNLYHYQDGAYSLRAEDFVRKEACRHFGDAWTSHFGEEVVEYIRLQSPHLWPCPPLDEINVLNGILNVESRRLREHDPAFLSPIQLPVEYDPTAKCPAWERQISQTFPDDAVEADVAYEVAAWLMTPDTSIQKSLLLIGEGGTGKSTFLDALTAFLGHDHISNVPLHKLEAERFTVGRLVGKLANICADLPGSRLETSSMFKAITGGDRIFAEHKYSHGFSFCPYARLVFSANQLPRSADASEAFFDRWLLLSFDRKFRGTDREVNRRQLDARLSDRR
jgi:putative DNA primase/helicase